MPGQQPIPLRRLRPHTVHSGLNVDARYLGADEHQQLGHRDQGQFRPLRTDGPPVAMIRAAVT